MNTQAKSAHDYIYVSVPTGSMVVGFDPEDIIEFEKDRASFTNPEIAPYWSYFSWYFRDELRGHEATHFSALWRFDKPWAKLNRLRREAGLTE